MEGIIAQLANLYLVESPGLLLFSPALGDEHGQAIYSDAITKRKLDWSQSIYLN